VQTPRFCGFCSIAGTLLFAFCGSRPLRISWLIVGMKPFTLSYFAEAQKAQKTRRLSSPRPFAGRSSNVQALARSRNARLRGRGGL
jgi:hypothetical protein